MQTAWRCSLILTIIALAAIPTPTRATEEANKLEIALDMATMLRSARSVIANNQKLINDATRGDKGLSGGVVLAKAIQIFWKTKGSAPKDFSMTSQYGRLRKAQMAAIKRVIQDNQRTINQQGLSFKGFVPAVFTRLVNEEFRRTMGQEADIKVTAPPALVRNRKARPDSWEIDIIRTRLSAPNWTTGKVYSAEAKNRGRNAFRVLVPEYYGKGCLTCHGDPKGELDLTGYPKEGGKLGDLGGVISVTLFAVKPARGAR
ncbi:MAG: DUF3365 domain-containing protein [Rhodospirillales bacterium]|nr:DUF3365 domain-containing protein [Rhodospirillales bacterium]